MLKRGSVELRLEKRKVTSWRTTAQNGCLMLVWDWLTFRPFKTLRALHIFYSFSKGRMLGIGLLFCLVHC